MKIRTDIGVGIALAIIIFVTLFTAIPSVKSLTSIDREFYDPLGNNDSSSFEYVGSVAREPPPGWSVTGGQRGVYGDVNDDGIVDITDSSIVGANWQKTVPPGDAGADINGDGIIDIQDAAIVSLNWGKTKKSLEGNYAWHIGGSGDYYMTRYVDSYSLSALEANRFAFGFWYLSDELYAQDGACRAEFTIQHGLGSQDTFTGVWTAPTTDWTAVYVEGYTANIVSIQVKIHLLNIKAFIDVATGSISDNEKVEEQYGSLAMGLNIFSYRKDQGMTMDGIVRAIPTLYAEAKPGYKIHWIELKVRGGIFVDEHAFNLSIPYAQQGNDKGYAVDPGAIEQQQRDELTAAGIIIPLLFTAVLTFGIPVVIGGAATSTMWVVTRYVASSTVGAGTKFVLPFLASDPDHRTAVGGDDDSVWERWPYLDWGANNASEFVNSANAAYDLDWTFDTDSAEWFGIQLEASVCFAEPVRNQYYGFWYLVDRATYTLPWNYLLINA